MSAKNYIRLMVDLAEETADLSDAEFRALILAMLNAPRYADAGRYPTIDLARFLLPRRLRPALSRLVKSERWMREDASAGVQIDGWVESNEGDWQVRERVARYRARQRDAEGQTVTSVTNAAVTGETNATVITPSEQGQEALADSKEQGHAQSRSSDSSLSSPPPPSPDLARGYLLLGQYQSDLSEKQLGILDEWTAERGSEDWLAAVAVAVPDDFYAAASEDHRRWRRQNKRRGSRVSSTGNGWQQSADDLRVIEEAHR
jgi:hypothetical protein